MHSLKRVAIELTKAEYKTASMRMEGKHGHELLATGYGDGARIYLVSDKVALYMYTGVYNQARKYPNSNPLKTRLEETFKLEYWMNPQNRCYGNGLGNNSGNMVVQTWSPILRDINAFIFWLNGMNGRPMTPNDTQTVTLGAEYLVAGPNLTDNKFTLQKATVSYHHLGQLRTMNPSEDELTISFRDMLLGKQLPCAVSNPSFYHHRDVQYGRTPEETASLSHVERQFYFEDEQGRIFSTTQTLGHNADVTKVDIYPNDKVVFMSMGNKF